MDNRDHEDRIQDLEVLVDQLTRRVERLEEDDE